MHALSFVVGGLLGGLAMHICLALENKTRRAAHKRVQEQASKAVAAWLATVDDYLKLRIGECEQPIAMQNRHVHTCEMLKLSGVLNETKV